MRQTVYFDDFERAFRDSDRYDNFGYEGLVALFDYLEELEEGIGEEIELDVIKLCCSYTLYTYEEVIDEFDISFESDNEEDKKEEVKAWLQSKTTVIEVDEDSIIIQNF